MRDEGGGIKDEAGEIRMPFQITTPRRLSLRERRLCYDAAVLFAGCFYVSRLSSSLWRALQALSIVLIGKVLVAVVINYRNYLPPNFEADFLLGRASYFWAGYHWAVYVHILAGPVTLVLGTVLVSDPFRQRFPRWHRRLGRIQGLCVLALVAPSGFAMAYRAASGPGAGLGFALLSLATAGTVALGWRAAVQRRFEVHRQWMWRCYLLLCSTVILRLIGGLGVILGINAEWFYAQTAWTSWLVPLAAYEAVRWTQRLSPRPVAGGIPRRPLPTRTALLNANHTSKSRTVETVTAANPNAA
jgi:hypothetical protein